MSQQTLLTCPQCGWQSLEALPEDEAAPFYNCDGCHQVLLPPAGICCAYRAYGSTGCHCLPLALHAEHQHA